MTRYQDYVIRDGRFVGRFDEMYRDAAEVPWRQDVTAGEIFSDVSVMILRQRRITSLLDVGCGLGYMTDRFRREIPELRRVVAIDVSPTAVEAARSKFPEIEFHAGTIGDAPFEERFEAVVSKDVLWYVLDDLAGYVAGLARHSSRWVYIGQSFPEQRPFLGDHILPDARGLFAFLEERGYRLVYSVVERDAAYDGREYAHALIEVPR